MKKVLIPCLGALLLFATGCKDAENKNTIQQQEQGTLPNSTVDTIPPQVLDTMTADTVAANTEKPVWYGSYSGSLPCGDCKGILTKLTLNADNTYMLSSQYLGKENKPNIYKGTYNLDDKKIVTLDAEGDHLKFLVKAEDEMLVKLDKFGDPEKGGPAARYFLHKMA
ncbi:copper resistance protein NlpE [Flavobacterium sp. RHBU_24]|uniref:copper resistance protein NlpE n=1 Tax=Flavobacterium sp. RHBU_24 TaxID=3391185 RepID=UPI0039855E16